MTRTQHPLSVLDPFFKPDSIAVIGASNNLTKPGGAPINALLKKGYQGKIYPVNPAYDSILGIKCYPSILSVPNKVDLALICLSADRVYQTMEECVAKGVPAAIIFSSGYAEVGLDGLAEQRRLKELTVKTGLRILGPNCLGLVNATNGVTASFASIENFPATETKELGFITQSGAFGIVIYAASLFKGVGFNYFVSVGNEADLEFADFLEYMINDPATKLIGGYLEGAKDGNKLRRVANEALQKEKPVLIIKAGRSSAGGRAAASHTGSLAGSDRVYDSFFNQTGIIRINDYPELIEFARLFHTGKLPRGSNTVILATSGGAGVTMTDLCEQLGLNIIPLKEDTINRMEKDLPSFASCRNPVDLTGAAVTSPEIIVSALRALDDDPDVDIIICSLMYLDIPPDHPVVREVVDLYRNSEKFILISPLFIPGTEMGSGFVGLKQAGIPLFLDTRETINALSKLVNYTQFLNKRKQDKYRPALRETKPELRTMLKPGVMLSESMAKAILAQYGIPITREVVVASSSEAADKALEIGYPVVLKIDSPDIPHKTEAGCVKLNIKSDSDVRAAFEEIIASARKNKPGARISGVLVQEMLPAGTEVIIGVSHDPVFGPVIMFGLGGIFVEVLNDVSFRVAPVSPGDAWDMIEEIKGYPLLEGVRGRALVDIEAIVDVILKVSSLVSDYGDIIEELDINPLIVYPQGVKVADSMLMVKADV